MQLAAKCCFAQALTGAGLLWYCTLGPPPPQPRAARARPRPQSYSAVTKTVYNNIVAQLELLGAPFSTGDAPSEGLRLVLGSDVTGVKGSDNGTQLDVPTRWLLPASVAAFDPRCNKSDMDAAVADGCTLIGARLLGQAFRGRRMRTGQLLSGLQHRGWKCGDF